MEIIDKNGYKYLKHSFRKNKKVITKEIYLGKTIPEDIEIIKKQFFKEIKKELFHKLKIIKEKFSSEWKSYPESVKKELLINFSVNFTYNTNAIEGSTITREETEELIKRKISPNKAIRDVQETINHSKVFLKMLNEKKDLSIYLISEWHTEIFKDSKEDIAGKIREYNVFVGDYRCPDWQDVPTLLKEMFNWYDKNKSKEHPVELAAIMHYKFVKIHPFGDGNGRIARMIVNYILKNNKYPLIVIEYKNRKSYYQALTKDETEFIKYFVRRYLSSYKKKF